MSEQDFRLELLKRLTEAPGVPGYEGPVRKILREYFQELGEVTQDRLGNLFCKKSGAAETPRVLLAGHMDEIGFMVKHITDQGMIRFVPLGGWFDQTLLGHRVMIHTHKGPVLGVIGAKPPHLIPQEERTKVVKKKDMFIDVGATSKEEVEALGVRVGDPIIPHAAFEVMANSKVYVAKAFDDRVGVAVAIETLRALQDAEHPNTVYAAATVQEEVGLRGATTAPWTVEPDVAIVLEVDIAGDVPGIKPEESAVKLGSGPTLLVYDRTMIPNRKLRDLVIQVAEEEGIPLQLSAIEGGGTDGGRIHLHKTGVPTVVISVPTRYIHSHSTLLHREDFDRAVALVTAVVKRLDAATVAGLTAD